MNIDTQDQSGVLEKNDPANRTNNTEIKSNSPRIDIIRQKRSIALINSNNSIVDSTYNDSTLKIITSPSKTFDNYQFLNFDNEKSAILSGNINKLDDSINNSDQDQSSIRLNERIEDKSSNNGTINSEDLIKDNQSEALLIIPPLNNDINDKFGSSNQTQNTELRIKSATKNATKIFTNNRVNETNNLNITTTITDDIRTTTPNSDQIDDENEVENEMRCYGELGCLDIPNSWYHLIYRPINVFSMPRDVINTSFKLYTNDNPSEGQLLVASKNSSSKGSSFDPKRKTKFIIHGFMDSSQNNWIKDLKNELLQHDDYNIIIVDWAGGSLLLLQYFQAVANTRLVGLEIAHLIRYLNANNGLKVDDVHLIGHSLGAHIAGYAGAKFQGQIGRISGLDPAKPDFEYMPSHVRLDPTDAKLVDVIHTDSGSIFGAGINHPCGHLDFYPNNGDEQPGCSSLLFSICDHIRAIELFTESINSKCQFIAYECHSYEKYLAGECFPSAGNKSSLGYGIMGYHADKSPALVQRLSMGQPAIGSLIESKFFISTGDKDPYCRRHYRITITLAKPDEATDKVQGLMNLIFYTDDGFTHKMDLTPNGNRIMLEHGETTKIVAVHPEGDTNLLKNIRKVDLFWTYKSDTPLLYCFFCNDKLYVDNIVVDDIKLPSDRRKRGTDFSSKFCSIQNPHKWTKIFSGTSATFVDNCH
ncbi:pancreatic lipase-related protein 2-like [Microplitis mediator]|uniref:pancreatic lipase-related protein 2-like n=1 Tax=Microplitis mediator TaxID=375433 RepID=UPI002553410B|nr:pancreatic lipase-related protein 2-like [Microplitis mediator]